MIFYTNYENSPDRLRPGFYRSVPVEDMIGTDDHPQSVNYWPSRMTGETRMICRMISFSSFYDDWEIDIDNLTLISIQVNRTNQGIGEAPKWESRFYCFSDFAVKFWGLIKCQRFKGKNKFVGSSGMWPTKLNKMRTYAYHCMPYYVWVPVPVRILVYSVRCTESDETIFREKLALANAQNKFYLNFWTFFEFLEKINDTQNCIPRGSAKKITNKHSSTVRVWIGASLRSVIAQFRIVF